MITSGRKPCYQCEDPFQHSSSKVVFPGWQAPLVLSTVAALTCIWWSSFHLSPYSFNSYQFQVVFTQQLFQMKPGLKLANHEGSHFKGNWDEEVDRAYLVANSWNNLIFFDMLMVLPNYRCLHLLFCQNILILFLRC